MTKAVKKKEVINFNTNKSDKKNKNKGVKDNVLVCCVLFKVKTGCFFVCFFFKVVFA